MNLFGKIRKKFLNIKRTSGRPEGIAQNPIIRAAENETGTVVFADEPQNRVETAVAVIHLRNSVNRVVNIEILRTRVKKNRLADIVNHITVFQPHIIPGKQNQREVALVSGFHDFAVHAMENHIGIKQNKRNDAAAFCGFYRFNLIRYAVSDVVEGSDRQFVRCENIIRC